MLAVRRDCKSRIFQVKVQLREVRPSVWRWVLIPGEATLGELHALSETFDTELGALLADARVTAADYIRVWQQAGRPSDRERQIALTLRIATDLDRLTRKPFLRQSLRLMRGPARAAGLTELQRFLESGFDTFQEMNGAKEFIDLVGKRERALAAALFAAGSNDTSMQQALTSLP